MKIKCCDMAEQPTYKYEIEYNGNVIAECKTLSSLENETWALEKTPLRQQYRAIMLSVQDWVFVDKNDKKLPVNFDTLDRVIPPKYLVTLSEGVFKKINEWREQRSGILKN